MTKTHINIIIKFQQFIHSFIRFLTPMVKTSLIIIIQLSLIILTILTILIILIIPIILIIHFILFIITILFIVKHNPR